MFNKTSISFVKPLKLFVLATKIRLNFLCNLFLRSCKIKKISVCKKELILKINFFSFPNISVFKITYFLKYDSISADKENSFFNHKSCSLVIIVNYKMSWFY